MAMLDERLTMNEDRVRRVDDKLDALLVAGGAPGVATAAAVVAAAKQQGAGQQAGSPDTSSADQRSSGM
jgi:hypothetical protein